MIAEMSEKKGEEAQEAPVANPTVEEQTPTKKAECDSYSKKASSPKTEAPKSSFAAWKLAKGKGRKNTSKSANRSDLSVATDMTADVAVEPKEEAIAAAKLLPEASVKVDNGISEMQNPLLAVFAAAAPLPVKKTEVADGHSQSAVVPAKKPPKTSTKKNSSAKKATVPAKKDMPSKKTLKKKGDGHAKGSGKVKSRKGDQAGSKAATFPEKIMDLLQAGLAPKAIYWLPEGEAIAVDPDNFKDSTVISKQFRGNKLSSFVRSLNRWYVSNRIRRRTCTIVLRRLFIANTTLSIYYRGFRRIFYHSLPDKTLAFYHRLFQKQAPALVKEMKMDCGEKESELPHGAMSVASSASVDGKASVAPAAELKKPKSPVATPPTVVAPAARKPAAPAPANPVRGSPFLSAAAPAPDVLQAALQAASKAAPAPAMMPQEPVLSAPAPVASASLFDRSALERLAETRHSLELQQAMAAEQERSDRALQALQAQQLLLQSLADQQNFAHAEELIMQSMLAEQQRSEIALQQRQAEQALLQQMLAEQETAALASALGSGLGGLDATTEALLRERLLLQQYGAAASHGAGGSDILALLQQQLQGAQRQQAREPSYMEQLLLLEQQQQRQQEAALLAAHGFHFG